MPAFRKFAWRWIVGTTAAAMLLMAALPSVGHADELSICINQFGKIRGVNTDCNPSQTELLWETVGPQGAQGAQGVQGLPGLEGAQGAAGGPGIQGSQGAQGPVGPTGDPGAAGIAGAQGPQGIQGNPGIQGIIGLPGNQGAPGTNGLNGGNQSNKTFLTGGTLGAIGLDENLALSGTNLSSPDIMGPGNGAAQNDDSVQVPMNDPGFAYNLFVNVDNNPGVNGDGTPIAYFFVLCANGSTCDVACTIVDPDTTCNDLVASNIFDFNFYNQGDLMGLFASASSTDANIADVKWSVTYDHQPFPFGTP